MCTRFEVGKSYNPTDLAFDPITIVKRTAKCVFVKGGSGIIWRMAIRESPDGCEYVTDSTVPVRWRYCFTYYADDPVRNV